MVVEEKHQDLFALDYESEYCLCHCVSEDLAMGKGIAVLFRDKFGGIENLRSQCKAVGETAAIPSGGMRIYYLITKPKYWNKPTYETLERSLSCTKNDMIQRGYTKLGMPKIGCGLDGLEWPRVRAMIDRLFSASGIDVIVCVK